MITLKLTLNRVILLKTFVVLKVKISLFLLILSITAPGKFSMTSRLDLDPLIRSVRNPFPFFKGLLQIVFIYPYCDYLIHICVSS